MQGDWSRIFAGLTSDHGKKLAEAAGQAVKADLVYGEVDLFSMAIILETMDPQQGQVFVDLGHGTGRGIVAAGLLYGHLLGRCYGMELLEPLVTASLEVRPTLGLPSPLKACLAWPQPAVPLLYSACNPLNPPPPPLPARHRPLTQQHVEQVQSKYEDVLRDQSWLYGSQRCEMVMEQGDLSLPPSSDAATFADVVTGSYHWTEAELIFVNSTCFSDDLMRKIAEQTVHMRPGAQIVTLTKELRAPNVRLASTRTLSMSWGSATAFFHVREEAQAEA